MRLSPICKALLWIGVLAFALRFSVRWYLGDADFWQNGYMVFMGVAHNIAAGHGISIDVGHPTAFRVPLYPVFLSIVTLGDEVFLPIVFFQSLIGVGTVLCTALITREMFGSTAAVIAAIMVAIYPYYVLHDTALQETGLYTFLTALAVFLLQQARRNGSGVIAAGAGLALGAAVLTRVSLAPFAMLAPMWLVVPGRARSEPPRKRLWAAGLCAAMLMLTVSPWVIRSYRVNGSATLSTETGFFLWLGNNPYTFSNYPSESIDRTAEVATEAFDSQQRAEIELLSTNEAYLDRWYLQKGLQYIRDHPWLTLGNGIRKVKAAFNLLPNPRRNVFVSLVHALSYGPVMILGLWGMWAGRQNWRDHLIFYALFVSFGAVTAVFFGHTSYRAYLDLYWIVFAAAVLARLQSEYLPNGMVLWRRAWTN